MKMTLGIKLALAGGLMESLYCSGADDDDMLLEFKREHVHLFCTIMMKKLCKHEYQIEEFICQ